MQHQHLLASAFQTSFGGSGDRLWRQGTVQRSLTPDERVAVTGLVRPAYALDDYFAHGNVGGPVTASARSAP
jgi:hypothetical protein